MLVGGRMTPGNKCAFTISTDNDLIGSGGRETLSLSMGVLQ